MTTSRLSPGSQIRRDPRNAVHREIPASASDLECYIDTRIDAEPMLLRHAQNKPELRLNIKETVMRNVGLLGAECDVAEAAVTTPLCS